jgi:hypothetical protein
MEAINPDQFSRGQRRFQRVLELSLSAQSLRKTMGAAETWLAA